MPVPNIHDLSMHELISANLMHFQFIEEYIREYFELLLASRSAEFKDIIPKDIPKDTESLGRLIEKFEKYNDNKKMIEELYKINKDRIRVVHKIWLEYMKVFNKAVMESKGRDLAPLAQPRKSGDTILNYSPCSFLDLVSAFEEACLMSSQALQ